MRIAALLFIALPAFAAEPPKFTVKIEKAEPRKALAAKYADALDEETVTVLNSDGTLRARFWFRKDIPAKATPEQVKNGLTYREIPEGTFLGLVQFAKPFVDFRKQDLPAGTYSLRLAVQPDTGDHKDTAPHQDFCLLVPVDAEKGLEPLETKDAVKLSLKVTESDHPAVLLMFPHVGKDGGAKIVAKSDGVSVVQLHRNVIANDKASPLGFAFAVDGVSASR